MADGTDLVNRYKNNAGSNPASGSAFPDRLTGKTPGSESGNRGSKMWYN